MSRMPTAVDHDAFHPRGADPWWTETVWFAWMVPERKLVGYFYPVFRPNLGVIAGGVTVFDDSAELPWELPFHAWDWHLPLPAGLDLRSARLDNGMSLTAEVPGRVFHLGYEHRGGLSLDLRYEAATAPLLSQGTPPFLHGHLDQIGRVTGTMTLHGERVPVDCLAMRDRSWGPRREGRQAAAGFCYAAVPGGPSFLAVSVGRESQVSTGFLVRDGVQARVVGGSRSVRRDPAGRPVAVQVEAQDEHGRSLVAAGSVVSRQVLTPYSSMLCWNSLLEWTFDGNSCWGEDQDVWHPRAWRDAPRDGAS